MSNIRHVDKRTHHPELYSAPSQPAAEDEVAELLAALVYALKPDFVLETGTAFGHTAAMIATALKRNGIGTLDTCESNANRQVWARQALKGLPVKLHECEYQDFKPPKGREYRLAFFDATHDARDEEFLHFKAHLPPGAFVLFHDCGEPHPGNKGVHRLVSMGLIKSLYLPVPRGAALAEVL